MKQVRNLLDELVQATECHQDHRFRPWAKKIQAVDITKIDGYAFMGAFVKEGTVEVEIGPKVYIVMTSEGSRARQTKTYTAILMDAEGKLIKAGIQTTGKEPGWALRLRDPVAELILGIKGQTLNPLAGFGDEELIAELQRRNYKIIK